jgi:hypothetical protein
MSSNSDISWKSGPSKGDIPKESIIDSRNAAAINTDPKQLLDRNEEACLWDYIDQYSGYDRQLGPSPYKPVKSSKNYMHNFVLFPTVLPSDFNPVDFLNELFDIFKIMLHNTEITISAALGSSSETKEYKYHKFRVYVKSITKK